MFCSGIAKLDRKSTVREPFLRVRLLPASVDYLSGGSSHGIWTFSILPCLIILIEIVTCRWWWHIRKSNILRYHPQNVIMNASVSSFLPWRGCMTCWWYAPAPPQETSQHVIDKRRRRQSWKRKRLRDTLREGPVSTSGRPDFRLSRTEARL